MIKTTRIIEMIQLYEVLTFLKLLIVGGALFVASLQDVRTREVSDKIWIFAVPAGGALMLVEVFSTPNYPYVLAVVSLLASVALAFGIYYAGLYGGADAKALTVIAITLPLPPYGYVGTSPIFPLTVLGNGIILSLSLIVLCAVWNISAMLRGINLFSGLRVSGWGKILAFLTGVKIREGTAKSVHFNLMERVMDDGSKELKFIHRVDEEIKEPVVGNDYVWATPAIPMIVFLLAGFILYFFAGDLVLKLVIKIMG